MNVLNTLLPILIPVVVAILTPIVTALVAKVLSNMPSKQRDLLTQVVHTAVTAVEQTASATLNGPGKKQLALELVQKELAQYGMKVPDSTIQSVIEETVLALNTAKNAQAVVSTQLPLPATESK